MQAPDGDGPVFWSVTARELSRATTVGIDTAPSAARPLVINVDGEGEKVRLDTPVTVAAAARAYVVWNVVNTASVVVARPLPGSLLAPTAAVQIDDDISGSVVGDTVTQTAGTVGTAPFGAANRFAPCFDRVCGCSKLTIRSLPRTESMLVLLPSRTVMVPSRAIEISWSPGWKVIGPLLPITGWPSLVTIWPRLLIWKAPLRV